MKKLLTLAFAATCSLSALAQEYSCTVHCKSNSGSIERISVSVSAGSSGDAAKIIDPQGHQLCRQAGYPKATESTMSASQCSRK